MIYDSCNTLFTDLFVSFCFQNELCSSWVWDLLTIFSSATPGLIVRVTVAMWIIYRKWNIEQRSLDNLSSWSATVAEIIFHTISSLSNLLIVTTSRFFFYHRHISSSSHALLTFWWCWMYLLAVINLIFILFKLLSVFWTSSLKSEPIVSFWFPMFPEVTPKEADHWRVDRVSEWEFDKCEVLVLKFRVKTHFLNKQKKTEVTAGSRWGRGGHNSFQGGKRRSSPRWNHLMVLVLHQNLQ